ncbi:MAG TPA: SIR2 family protein [Pseudolabrys sp.]|nr:SIR2 family protein [Pseudolabrys sp.]
MAALDKILAGFGDGLVMPYLGPGVLSLAGADCPLPGSPEALVAKLTAQASVPHKIRNSLSAAAQFIENFKHRKTVAKAMSEAFAPAVEPSALHRYLAALPKLPLVVHTWYDDLPQKALTIRRNWGMVQGVSQTEHFGNWVHYFRADGTRLPSPPGSTFHTENVAPALAPDEADGWSTLLYQPLGSVWPAANFLVSDTDYVEVLTEIDIQTPIPMPVQDLRKGRHFLFLGCRFAHQLDRLFARQIMKRSSDRHWAVLPEPPTRNEARFLQEHGIERIDMPLAEFAAALATTGSAPARALAG